MKFDNKKKFMLMLICIAVAAYAVVFGIDSHRTLSFHNIHLGLDLAGGVSVTYEVVEKNVKDSDIEDTMYKIQKRIEDLSAESEVYREGENRITVDIPGVTDANKILEMIGKPGALSFIDSEGNEVLTGADVKTSDVVKSNDNISKGEYLVSLKFTEEGTKKFAEATKKNLKKQILIVYDEKIVSAPTVESTITTGEATISGMSDYDEANALATTIRTGALPLELKELRSSVVGAKLGQEAIQTSLKAGVIGFLIIVAFMIVAYKISGVAASIALVVYVLLVSLILNLFDIALTLPGVAGIVLSVGMAVDANMIIFTRIKEEITAGQTVKAAINAGFKKALAAIVDVNITSLIAVVVLYQLGSGTVKGFAMTLAIGVLVSMFTALTITKMIIMAFHDMGMNDVKYYGKIKQIPTMSIVKNRFIIFAISIILIVIGFVKMGMNSSNNGDILNYGLDFKGGTLVNVTLNEDVPFDTLDKELKPALEKIVGSADIQIQKVEGTNEVNIKTPQIERELREKVENEIIKKYKIDNNQIATENISSTVSTEMRKDAIVAVIVALICMLIYIWMRFKDLRFGASAVIALFHNVLIVITVYAVLDISVGNIFIACLLTVVGYTINDTIVIFDRIRENLRNERKLSTEEIVNISVTQTLTRSINTSLTTFIMLLVLYVFGVTSIKEFTLPLMAGIIAGTYASVFETGTMWCMLRKLIKQKK